MTKLKLSGTLIGIGMGGFVDGIVFHQIFQLHNMLSNRLFPDTLVNTEINMFWDGLFHAFTWVVTAVGIAVLWRLAERRDEAIVRETFAGSLLLGWGSFNLIEGLIDHQILQVHHVVERADPATQLFWDLAFLASGIIMIAVGLWLRSKAFTSHQPRRSLWKPRSQQV